MHKPNPLVVLISAIAVSGCGSTQGANQTARTEWLNKSADEFFAKHGPPLRQYTMAGGGKVFSWETVAMPTGVNITVGCSSDIVTDGQGLIREIRLQRDSIGLWNMSRCSEVFGQ